MKKVIWKDEEAIARLKKNVLECLPVVQGSYKEYRNSDLFDPGITISQLLTRFDEIKISYHRKVLESEFKPSGRLSLNEAEMMRLFQLKLPVELTNSLKQAKEMLDRLDVKPEVFAIEDGKAIVDDTRLKRLVDCHILYAENKKQGELFDLLISFIKVVTDMNEFIEKNRIDVIFARKLLPVQLAHWLDWNGYNYSVNLRLFRRLQRQLRD